MAEPLIVPIRHHSPVAARYVRELIAARHPRRVLIEGPADATPLIPLLADPTTVPPVAIYAYRPGAEGHAAFYPFCGYSPEYVAMAAGQDVGAEVRFCDVPASVSLSQRGATVMTDGEQAGEAEEAKEPALDYGDFLSGLAEAGGTSSFEEFWEAGFEQELADSERFLAAMGDFGEKTRQFGDAERDAWDGLRERTMAAAIRDAEREGIPRDEVVLVCGAAHAAAVRAALEQDAELPQAPADAPVELALIAYSYPRLAEQSGYGAGNRAPWFYGEVWSHGNDYDVATRRALVALAARLRRQGQAASLAQCIDAYNLAKTLARMREKWAPGVDELADAATACFGQGQPVVVGEALRGVLIGDAVGRVTQRVGKTPLQSEFYATANRLGLPVLDAPRQILLHMTSPRETEQSIFLHRLAVAKVPFAQVIESGGTGRPRVAAEDPLAQLGRVREKWDLQWSPSTDTALVEQTAWGNTLVQAAGALLRRDLGAVSQVDEATGVLLRLVLCDLLAELPVALDRCEALAAGSGSFPSLARAAYHLDGLLTYGAARRLAEEPLVALARRLFARAVLHLPSAVTVDDQAAGEVERGLISLHELVRRESPVVEDAAEFWQAVARTGELASCHPGLRGLCLVLQEIAGRLPPGRLAALLGYWLSRASDAADNARLVAGLFTLHRGTLIRNPAVIGAVTEFLAGLEIDQLIGLLPVLRRTLGSLSAAERNYLDETLSTVLGLAADDGDSREVSTEEIERARAADAAVAAILAEWRERYGVA